MRILIKIGFLIFIVLLIFMLSFLVFDDNRLPEANVIWKDDFNSPILKDWAIIDIAPGQKSDWHVYEGYLVNTSNIGGEQRLGSHIVAGNTDWRDYTVRAEIISTDDDYIGILFRYQDADNYYRFYVSGQNGQIFLEKRVNDKIVKLASAEEPLDFCKMTFTAAVRDDTIRVYINNREYFKIIDGSHPTGKVGFMTCYNEGAYFNNITVSTYYEIPVERKITKLEFWCAPYLQNVLGDSATIMWQTNLPSNSAVEYGLINEPQYRIEMADPKTVHEICLRNLKRDTQYFYRIISDTLTSAWYSFHSAKSNTDPFRFVLYSDSQNNFIIHKKIASELAKHQPDFIVSAGDLAHGGRRADWATEFFHPMKEILSSTPIYVSVGNHAYGSPHFTDYFSFPEKNHETYYSVQAGNAYFIFLDNAKADFPDKDYYTDIDIGSPQYDWLVKELGSDAAQKAEWLFVVAHVPCYSEYSEIVFTENVNTYVPLYKHYNVDAVFSGHVHVYERGVSEGVCYIITGGAGGTLDFNKHRDINEIQVTHTGHHYCIVDIEGSKLTFRQYSIDGVLCDSFSIDKTKQRFELW